MPKVIIHFIFKKMEDMSFWHSRTSSFQLSQWVCVVVAYVNGSEIQPNTAVLKVKGPKEILWVIPGSTQPQNELIGMKKE